MPPLRIRLIHWKAAEAQEKAAGLVDYKISAIDATWSGLRFAVRKPK